MTRDRHTHPGLILTVVVALTAVAMVLGTVASDARNAAGDAKETAEIARAVTDPNCNPKVPACKRANAQRRGQGSVVPDIEEVSVIASYCGHVASNDTLAEVRSCVESEFRRLTGRAPQLQPTTTIPGG